MSNPVIEFRAVLDAAGLLPTEIIGDGAIHRCGSAGKEKGKDGAYVLHLDYPPSGWWRNFRTGQKGIWTARNAQPASPEERRLLHARIESDKAKRIQEETRKHAQASQKTKRLIARCAPATKDHPYRRRKGVTFVDGIRVARDGRLVLPVYDAAEDVISVQFIDSEGQKRFLTGGRTKGGYFCIEGSEGPLYIAEGIATGASIHAATGHSVLVAFNASNLEAVATMARAKHPQRKIILCVDDDRQQKENPGLTKGVKAAQQIHGFVAVPTFAEPRSGTDFNDLALAEGLDVVRTQLAKARAPESSSPVSLLPHGFEERKGGIYFLAENKDGDITPEWVCSQLRVLALTRDADKQEWGRLLEVIDPDGAAHKWALPMSMLSGNGEAYRAHLLSLGLRLAPGGKGNNRLHMLLSLTRPEARARCASRIGWFGARFVLPEGTIGNDQGEEIHFSASA
jgi:putative DNA primase/helicase